MPTNIGQIVAATVAALAPFTPFLIETGKAGSKKLAEVLAERGGETAWKRAQALWAKLKDHFKDDPEVKSAATMVAAKPKDESRQKTLAEVLSARLQEKPEFAEELLDLLGGQQVLQEILVDCSWVEDVVQQMKGSGVQRVKAKDSIIIGVRQQKEE